MKYKNLYLAFVFISMLSITSAFFLLKNSEKNELKEPVDIPLSSNLKLLGQNSTNGVQSQQAKPSQNSSTGLGLQNSGQITQPRLENQLPSPENFNLYEEYSASESPLYIDAKIGIGREAQSGKKVAMLYKGYLTNGELFDQSRLNDESILEPFVFEIGIGQVISGWEATIPGMKVGGSRRLIIPAQFGYGPLGQGSIPPNAMLIFDVELIAVE